VGVETKEDKEWKALSYGDPTWQKYEWKKIESDNQIS
jgi:hypothetical protein